MNVRCSEQEERRKSPNQMLPGQHIVQLRPFGLLSLAADNRIVIDIVNQLRTRHTIGQRETRTKPNKTERKNMRIFNLIRLDSTRFEADAYRFEAR